MNPTMTIRTGILSHYMSANCDNILTKYQPSIDVVNGIQVCRVGWQRPAVVLDGEVVRNLETVENNIIFKGETKPLVPFLPG